MPVPVTAVAAESLLDNDQLTIQDYYTRAPGLSVAPDQLEGTSRITIRGLTTGGLSNPTVGIVVDDVPYGSSTGIGSGYLVPDIDPNDLERIEVLRGPQGTLYGASSMGGLIK
ncbi:MAG TPA: Plug domain-containing protein, partial [Steroidobacteraceae bacterium]|nr:Plug domain-containing protein [Steroidobacteraceae bacterium]